MNLYIQIVYKSLLVIIALIALYAGIAALLSNIAVNKAKKITGDIPIYILSNGVHTDIVLPVKSELIDWSEYIPYSNINTKDTSKLSYLAFGWGDKGFYLNTPTWADLTFTTAFKAAFGLSTTAMHCTYHSQLTENENCIRVTITPQEHEKIIQLIQTSFDGARFSPITIPNQYYGATDSFYEAKGTYSLFFTCNSWANAILKQSNQKACVWTPVDWGILNQYK